MPLRRARRRDLPEAGRHQLRRKPSVTASFSSEQPVAAATRDLMDLEPPSPSPLRLRVDRKQIPEQYEEMMVLELEELTPHQKEKLKECKGRERTHVRAAAGAGKYPMLAGVVKRTKKMQRIPIVTSVFHLRPLRPQLTNARIC